MTNGRAAEASDLCLSEAAYAFEADIGDCAGSLPPRYVLFESSSLTNVEKKQFNAVEVLTSVTIRVVACVIVGEELARDEEFLKVAKTYFKSNFLAGVILLKLPLGIFRNVLGGPIAYVQRQKLRKLISLVSPVIEKRMQEKAQGVEKSERMDGIEWTLKLSEEYPFESNESGPVWGISKELIQNLWAGGSSPAAVITQMLFHILEDPSYLEPMRKEVEAAVAKHGWSERIINDLPLQDSFIREVNRFYPIFTCWYLPFLTLLPLSLTFI